MRQAIGIGAFLLIVVLPVAYLVYGFFVPHLLLNPTTRYLYQYREMTRRDDGLSLIPGLFQGGESKNAVESQLLGAGLEPWGTRNVELPPGVVTVQRFRLRAGMRDIACGSELFLTASYGEDDTLNSATLSQGGACL